MGYVTNATATATVVALPTIVEQRTFASPFACVCAMRLQFIAICCCRFDVVTNTIPKFVERIVGAKKKVNGDGISCAVISVYFKSLGICDSAGTPIRRW